MTAASEVFYSSDQPELVNASFEKETDATVLVFPTSYNPNALNDDIGQVVQPESTIRYDPSASRSPMVAAHHAVRAALQLGPTDKLNSWYAQNLIITDRRKGMQSLGLTSQVLVTADVGSSLPSNEGQTFERSFAFDKLGGPESITEAVSKTITELAIAHDAAEDASHPQMVDSMGTPIEKHDYRMNRVLTS